MESELQTYRDQLAYVNLSLESDPSNDELNKLKKELLEIIELTESSIAQTSVGTSKAVDVSKGKGKGKEGNWQDQGPYKAGMDCMAKYKDGKWYVQLYWRGGAADGVGTRLGYLLWWDRKTHPCIR
jgi:survival-of-motor-neuron-related-splicing factor 30